MPDLVLPRPLPHQIEPLADPARFKLWNWGRRSGKSRGSFVAAVAGHGPGSTWDADHRPRFPGMVQGGEVIWVARDYPQALTIWQEEVRPRFAGVVGVTIHEQTRQVRVQGGGMLEVRSAEAIDGIRGRGANLAGLILDEAAHWDLAYAWRAVLLPALLDHDGWAILNSSPNAGHDGNPEHRVPSHFNALCGEALAGSRPDWSYCHRTARDNPAIDPAALHALIAEYPAGSPQLAQEVEAKLLASGAGLAFGEYDAAQHEVTSFGAPDDYRWFAGLDWGYRSPGACVLLAAGPDRELVARWDTSFRETPPEQVGRELGTAFQRADLRVPEWIAGDLAMWGVTDGVSIAERVQAGLTQALGPVAPALVACPKGPRSRVTGWQLVHEALAFDPAHLQPDGTLAPFHRPRLRFHRDAAYLRRSLPALPADAKDPEDVNTDADDHAADALRYALVLRQPEMQRTRAGAGNYTDRERGWHRDGTPKRPQLVGYDAAIEAELDRQEGAGFRTGIRWEPA